MRPARSPLVALLTLLALLIPLHLVGCDAADPTGGGGGGGNGGGNGGGGNGGGGSNTGQLSIWTNYSASNIDVTIDGLPAGTLTMHFPNGTPACGQQGTLTLTLSAGTHTVSAVATNGAMSWAGGPVTVTGGQCYLLKLNGTGGGGGGGGGGGDTGRQFTSCTTAPPTNIPPSQLNWIAMPGDLSGLDYKLYFRGSFYEVLYRNRYYETIHFSHNAAAGNPPATTSYRSTMSAGEADTVPGHYFLYVSAGDRVCMLVNKVRFGPNDSGPYY